MRGLGQWRRPGRQAGRECRSDREEDKTERDEKETNKREERLRKGWRNRGTRRERNGSVADRTLL